MSTLYTVAAGLDSVDTREAIVAKYPETDDDHPLGDVNPGGQYGWLEAKVGVALTSLLADLLAKVTP